MCFYRHSPTLQQNKGSCASDGSPRAPEPPEAPGTAGEMHHLQLSLYLIVSGFRKRSWDLSFVTHCFGGTSRSHWCYLQQDCSGYPKMERVVAMLLPALCTNSKHQEGMRDEMSFCVDLFLFFTLFIRSAPAVLFLLAWDLPHQAVFTQEISTSVGDS